MRNQLLNGQSKHNQKTKNSIMKPICIHTYNDKISYVISFLSSKICPILIDISSSYNSLGIGNFDQPAYEDLVMNRDRNISERFRSFVETEIQNTRLSTPIRKMLDSENYISESLKPIQTGIIELFNEMNRFGFNLTSKGEVFFSDIEIINSLPKIKEEEITRRYQIMIDTPEKLSILKKMEEMVRIYDELRHESLKVGVYVVPDFDNYFQQQENGSLTINPSLFEQFNELSEASINALKNVPNIHKIAGNKMESHLPQ